MTSPGLCFLFIIPKHHKWVLTQRLKKLEIMFYKLSWKEIIG